MPPGLLPALKPLKRPLLRMETNASDMTLRAELPVQRKSMLRVWVFMFWTLDEKIYDAADDVPTQDVVQTLAHGLPPQQFSVRNDNRQFMVEKFAL